MSELLRATRLTVEVESSEEPIRGTVTDDHGNATPFVGWMALISVLEDHRHTVTREE